MSIDPSRPRELPQRPSGFTLVEMMAAVVMTSIIVLSLSEVVSSTLRVGQYATDRNERVEDARFVLERMVRAIEHSEHLFLPRPDNPGTPQDESHRDPGVLAVALAFDIDRDFDGIPDADNDGDGKFNEDPTGDLSGDGLPGIALVDDDNDGEVDEVQTQSVPGGNLGPLDEDDDEDDFANEDGWNGIDDDGDGWIDEDPKKDLSGDGVAGEPGVDENGDGTADNADKNDDDEDGSTNEDWFDTVVFRLVGTDLVERIPVPWDIDASGDVTGADYLERVIADRVARFSVSRLVQPAGLDPLLEISIALEVDDDAPVLLTTRVRLAAGS